MSTNRIENINILVKCFRIFLKAYAQNCPFRNEDQVKYHKRSIEIRKNYRNIEDALKDDNFLMYIYSTIKSWGIGKQGSILFSFDHFVNDIRKRKKQLIRLDHISIDDSNLDIKSTSKNLSDLIFSLNIVDNEAKLVSSTKTLHHLLPDLVVPMDRTYTKTFFGWNDYEFQHEQKKCFEEAFRSFVWIAKEANPKQYLDEDLNTCKTKIVDNAIVGIFNGGLELVEKYIKIK